MDDLISCGLTKIRAALLGDVLGLLAAPFGDFLMVAGKQHLGDRPALEVARPRVMRIFEEAGGEALLGKRDFVAGDARQQPHAGVDQHERGKLAA